jgi:hypothetical protein
MICGDRRASDISKAESILKNNFLFQFLNFIVANFDDIDDVFRSITLACVECGGFNLGVLRVAGELFEADWWLHER